MKKFFSEFKTFIAKGNVMDLAVGMIIGSTFTKIVNSIVNDIINPFVSLLTGRTSFQDMFIILSEHVDEAGNPLVLTTLEEAKAAGATVIAYGNLIQVVLDFIITALAVFLIVKGINKLREAGEKLKKQEEPKEEAAE